MLTIETSGNRAENDHDHFTPTARGFFRARKKSVGDSTYVIASNGGDDGARTRDFRRDRAKATSVASTHQPQFQLVARTARRPFLRRYSKCCSSRGQIYASCGM